jgi:Tol biopolymer transport system component
MKASEIGPMQVLMRQPRSSFGALLAAMTLTSCGGGSGQQPPPSGLSYPGPITAIVGEFLAPVMPTVAGTVTRYTVGPALPEGLQLDPYGGAISGTAVRAVAAATYTVVAHNDFGYSSYALQLGANNPAPALSQLNPSSIAAESPGFTLSVTGTGFQAGATVVWNGVSLAAASVSTTQLSVSVPAALLHTLGLVPVSVRNLQPGGGDAPPLTIHVTGPLRLTELADGSAPNAGALNGVLSSDGRYLAFVSSSSDLVAGDTNGAYDTFVLDSCLGATAECVPSTQRVSLASDGSEPNADSGYTTANLELGVSISGTGRYVAFVSAATNLVAADTNGADDVFVRDTCIGAPADCTPRTTLVSVGLGGGPANGGSAHPAISRSGRFVAFASSASDLVTGDNNNAYDIFVRDTCAGAPTGCVAVTWRASVSDAGVEGNSDSIQPAFSGNERYLAFASNASNLVAGDNNGVQDVFVRDTCFGAAPGCIPSTRLVSLGADGSQANFRALYPKLSFDGRYVSFISEATNLVSQSVSPVAHAFLRDTCVGAPSGCAPSTWLESEGSVWTNSMSDDARYLAFESSDYSFFFPSDPNPTFNVLVRDTCTGADSPCTPHTTRVSIGAAGVPPDNQNTSPSLSADGRLVSFTSGATNLLPIAVPPVVAVYATEAH